MSNEIILEEATTPGGSTAAMGEFEDLDLSALAQFLTEEVIPCNSSGFTLCPITQRFPVFPPTVYIASLLGSGKNYPTTPSKSDVLEWLIEFREQLSRYGHYIGYCPDGVRGGVDLDVSVGILGLRRAFDFARMNLQRAIDHPASGKEISVV